MIKNVIIDVAYFLNKSRSYQNVKSSCYNILEDSNNKYKRYFDIFMIILIFMSVAILIREVKSHTADGLSFFNTYVISFIFFIEYILRLWVSSSVTKIIIQQNEDAAALGETFKLLNATKKILSVKLRYIFTFKAIIDLLAILPFLHQLRLLRVFIIFRVFKLLRYAKSIQTFSSVLASKKFEFLTLLIFASIIIFVSAVLIYVMEANHPEASITTLFGAVYWSIVTISTVGYGDISPVTDEGQVVAMFVIVAGIGVFSFTTSLIVTSFTEKLDEIKDMKIIDDIAKIKEFYLVCGYGDIAREVAKKLSLSSKVIIIDANMEKIELAKKDGLTALNYDPGSTQSYHKLRINIQTQVKAILCLGQSDVDNVYTALTVRSFNKEVPLLSLLKNKQNRNKLNFAGVNEMFYENELVGIIAKEFAVKPLAFEASHALIFGTNEYTLEIEKNIQAQYEQVTTFALNDTSENGFDLSDEWESISSRFDMKTCSVFCILEDMAENIFLTISLRDAFEDISIVSLAKDTQSVDKLLLAGASQVIPATQATANVIVDILQKPIATKGYEKDIKEFEKLTRGIK